MATWTDEQIKKQRSEALRNLQQAFLEIELPRTQNLLRRVFFLGRPLRAWRIRRLAKKFYKTDVALFG